MLSEIEAVLVSASNTIFPLVLASKNYPMTELGVTVGHMEIFFTAQFQLTLKTGTNGNKTLWFQFLADQQASTNVSAVMNQTYYTTEQAVGNITLALSLIGIRGPAASSMATKTATTAAVENGEVEAEVSADEIQSQFQNVLEDPVQGPAFADNASSDAANMLKSDPVNIRNTNLSSSVAKWSSAAASITGTVLGTMEHFEGTLEKAATGQWDETPAFTNFANKAISRYSFGGLTNLEVQTASLADSMQIGYTAPS